MTMPTARRSPWWIVLLLAGCGAPAPPESAGPGAVTAADATPQTSVFLCERSGGELRFVTRTGTDGLSVWLPLEFGHPYLLLGRVPSASGERYEGEGVVVWNKGDETLLQVDDQEFKGCRRDAAASIWEHAKLSGVDFRAVGNEPGWTLEISEKHKIDFVYDYGESRFTASATGPVNDPVNRQATYEASADGHRLSVRIVASGCHDSMSGEYFESAVLIIFDDETYRGCGRPLH